MTRQICVGLTPEAWMHVISSRWTRLWRFVLPYRGSCQLVVSVTSCMACSLPRQDCKLSPSQHLKALKLKAQEQSAKTVECRKGVPTRTLVFLGFDVTQNLLSSDIDEISATLPHFDFRSQLPQTTTKPEQPPTTYSVWIPSLFENEFEYPSSQAKRSAFHAPHHTVHSKCKIYHPSVVRW